MPGRRDSETLDVAFVPRASRHVRETCRTMLWLLDSDRHMVTDRGILVEQRVAQIKRRLVK
jgi:hypothetical protein